MLMVLMLIGGYLGLERNTLLSYRLAKYEIFDSFGNLRGIKTLHNLLCESQNNTCGISLP